MSAMRPSAHPAWRTFSAPLVAMALLACLIGGPAQAQRVGVLDVRSAHTKAMAGEIVLVDIRTPPEWRETGLPASAHAVDMEQKAEVVLGALTKLVGGDKTKPLALICQTGGRSGFLAGQLKRVGFTQVIDVSEGMGGSRAGPGWLKSGLPTRPGAEASQPPKLGQAPKLGTTQ